MEMKPRRVFVEKKEQFRVEAMSLLAEFNENLSLGLGSLRLINVYDLFGFSDDLLEKSRYSVFGEVVTDTVTDDLPLEGKKFFAVEFIPGQFDQRASSAVDCVHLIDPEADIDIKSARLLVFDDTVSVETLAKIRHYFINPVECRQKDLSVLALGEKADVKPLEDLSGFTGMTPAEYPAFCKGHGLAINADDLGHLDIIGLFKELLDQLRSALAHGHRAQRTVARMGIGSEDHISAGSQHFTGKLVDDRLMRRHIDTAVALGARQAEHMIVLIDRAAHRAE